MDALLLLGELAMVEVQDPTRVHPGQLLEQSRAWLKSFACERSDNYSHSSLFGSRDHLTSTGRLSIPDVSAIRDELDRHVVRLHGLSKPLCWVEMATVNYPFYEDIDIMGTSRDKPPVGS